MNKIPKRSELSTVWEWENIAKEEEKGSKEYYRWLKVLRFMKSIMKWGRIREIFRQISWDDFEGGTAGLLRVPHTCTTVYVTVS